MRGTGTGNAGRVLGLAGLGVLCAGGTLFAQGFEWPDEPENLQVLEGFAGDELAPVMRGFSMALGVRCSFCHVGEEGAPLSTYDFASDDNEHKLVARTMLRMLGVINDTLRTLERDGHDHAPVNMWCHTCHRGRPRPLTLVEELGGIYEHDGAAAALDHYEQLRERFYGRGSFDFGESSLNEFGYEVLRAGDTDGAVLVFRRNVELFPDSGNVHDSLGEAYMLRGDRELAIESYERSLELDPRNRNAEQKLGELRGG